VRISKGKLNKRLQNISSVENKNSNSTIPTHLHSHLPLLHTQRQRKQSQKRVQATAPDSADIRANLTRHTIGRKEERTDNKGLKEMAGSVVNQTFVLSTNFCGRLIVRASKPPLL
jgi:hypothetical protein